MEQQFYTRKKVLLIIISFLLFALTVVSAIFLTVSALQTNKNAYEGNVSPDSLWNCSGKVILSNAVAAPYYVEEGNGMYAQFNQTDASITYKNPIDVSKNTKEDVLFSFMTIPDVVGEVDFNELHITLTDAEDASNYITVRMFYYKWDSGQSTYWSLYYSGSPSAWLSTRWGTKPLNPEYDSITGYTEEGLTIYKSMVGLLHTVTPDDYLTPFAISYDAADKTVYVQNHVGFWSCILDLDNAEYVGPGNEWTGFKGNNIYLTVAVKGMQKETGGLLVYDVNGNDMSAEKIMDVKAPSLVTEADKFEVLPYGEVGKEYPVFGASATDEIDGIISDNSIKVTVEAPDGQKISISKNYVPYMAGRHELFYMVNDEASNSAVRNYYFDVFTCLDDFELQFDDGELEESVQVGERVTIPSAQIKGGSEYGLQTGIKIYNVANGKEYSIEKGYFIPDSAGIYNVQFYVEDHNGTSRTFDYYIYATRDNKPIAYFMSEANYPKAFIGGKKTELPLIEAYDYSTNPVYPQKAGVKVSYCYNDSSDFVELDDYIFTPDLTKQFVSIKYTVFTGNELLSDLSNAVEKVYENIEIVAPQNVDDYFFKENASVAYSNKYIEFSAKDESKDMTLEYINVLTANSFEINFNIAQSNNGQDAGKNNFSSFIVALTDAEDSNISLTFEIKKNTPNTQKCDVYFGGVRYQMDGSFFYNPNESAVPFVLKFNNKTGELTDYHFNRILLAKKDDSGNIFTGFPSGGVRMRIELKGVNGASSFCFNRLVNQTLYAQMDSEGQPEPFKDTIRPIIEYSFTYERDGQFGHNFTLPSAKAYDVIDPYVEVKLIVKAPDGSVVFEGKPDNDITFKLTQYGMYDVEYTAEDSSGRIQIDDSVIEVFDKEKPQIMIKGDIPATLKVGESLSVPDALLFDNLTPVDKLRLYIFVTDPRLVMKDITESGRITFERTGTYLISYLVYDETGNCSLTTFNITIVEG